MCTDNEKLSFLVCYIMLILSDALSIVPVIPVCLVCNVIITLSFVVSARVILSCEVCHAKVVLSCELFNARTILSCALCNVWVILSYVG